jgi:hypothetical protein
MNWLLFARGSEWPRVRGCSISTELAGLIIIIIIMIRESKATLVTGRGGP